MQANEIDKSEVIFKQSWNSFSSYMGELFRAPVLNLWAMDHFCQISDKIILEIKCTINVMNLNHPKTIPPPPPQSMEELSFLKLVPGTKRLATVALEYVFLKAK